MVKLPWYFKLAFLFCLPAALMGCAQLTQPVKGVCAVLPLGQNEEGVQFIRYECRPDQ